MARAAAPVERAATMVGADRYDDGDGYPAASHATSHAGTPTGAVGEAPRAIGGERPPDPDSYWANIDYPPSRPQFVTPPVDSGLRRRQARRRNAVAALVAAALLLGSTSYAVGHRFGHAPVPGLHRRIATLEQTVASQRSQLQAQAATLAADRERLRQVSDSPSTVAACRRAIDDADHAFGTESAALAALSGSDSTTAHALSDQFGTELLQFAAAAQQCRAAAIPSTSSV